MLLSRSVLLLALYFISNATTYSQVVINEICTSNNSLLLDEDGDYPDWIELYNSGATPVNLLDYSLSDDATQLRKWTFPNYTLAPSAHVLVYASDKNRSSYVHHWETAIKDDDTWKYQAPVSAEPAAGWKLPAFNDAAWPAGQGGFGFGDADDNTVLPTPLVSVYIRKTFSVTDKTKIAEAILHMDYDDGFVAYLNGYRIASANMPPGIPPYNTNALAGHEATMYLGGMPEARLINKDTLMMALVNGTNVLCIQVHNNNAASSDLTARAFLSLGISDASVLYNPTPTWFTVATSLPLHTNFKLSAGDPVYLVNELSVPVDYKATIAVQTDHSYGRKPDGGTVWEVFTAPTPGATNNSAASVSGYCNDALNFSVNAGFYSSAQTVAITGSSEIRYTLDGSDPSPASALYTAPISISSTKVLKAGCFSGGRIPYQPYTNSYFINAATTLPVFSISTAPGLMFDPMTGIYMLGPNADSANSPYFGANFWEDIDIPVYVEFFEKNNTQIFEQGSELRIYGNYSRANRQKSLALKAAKRFGKDHFAHSFFPEKHIRKFSQIVLRNSGGDFNYMHYRDGFIQKSVSKKTALDIQDYRPAAVYINGEYWGILNIREKINEQYVEDNSGIDKDSIDLAETWGQALHGTNNLYVLQWWAANTDMTVATNYKMVADSFDLDNVVDYFSTEIFISNWDWPQNNVKFWRPVQGARKWRYILWDTDISLGLFNLNPVSFNQLGRIKNAPPITATGNIGPHADIFNGLLKNTAFRNKFINRYADLMNTLFRPSTLDKLLYDMRDSIAVEMPRHQARWSAWQVWPDEIQNVKTFYTSRIGYARNEVRNEFSLTKQVNITLAVSPAGAGYVKINTIYPDVFPWTGVYFDGVPVEITAIANPGYTFSYWQSSTLIPSPNTNKKITLNVSSLNELFTAHFTGAAVPLNLTVSEINYHSKATADAGDWLELYNYGAAEADLSNWRLKDYHHEYVLPDNTKLASGARLVLCSDLAKFGAQFPTVSNVIGPIGFSLGNEDERIALYNERGDQYLAFTYEDGASWPIGADGLGYTLESVSPTATPGSPASWFTGCLGGSPGSPYDVSCVLVSSTETIETQGLITVFPNPAKNFFTIDIQHPGAYTEWKLISPQGIELQKKEIISGSSVEKIDVSGFASGLYSLVLYGKDSRMVKKIIVQ